MYQLCIEKFKELFGDREFTGIEIGVLGGQWTWSMLMTFPNLKMIHAIDPWKHFSDELYERIFPQDVLDKNYEQYCKRMEAYAGRFTTWKMESSEAIKHLKDVKVDFVFIDGCHDEKFVEEDVVNYYPLVVDGGFFGGHDYGQAEGVTNAVNRHFKKVFVEDDFVWWVKKNEM